ncbi:uncharacterized protein [Diadema antillarum]|uniref:uncharacterized protein n=1 Tax=Diadema antillarum TaxID=105358 RepID=UPI003A885F29
MINDVIIGPPIGKSDHVTITFEMDVSNTQEEEEPITRSYYHADYDKMRSQLKDIDWNSSFENATGLQAWDIFEMTLHRAIEDCVPLKRKRKRNRPEWMNNEALEAVRRKRKAWNKYRDSKRKQHPDVNLHWKEYVRIRNITTSVIRKAKADFENKLAEEIKQNAKSFWNYVKKQTKPKSTVPDLQAPDGRWAKEDQEKAETLNNYFGSVFSEENTHAMPFVERNCNDLLTDIEITTEEIDDLLEHLDINKSPGPDGIHSRVLKETHAEIAEPLQMIFTKLINEGKCPLVWKQATVVPIFKKGKKSDPANY